MPGVKKSNDVELQLHESDAAEQTEVSRVLRDDALLPRRIGDALADEHVSILSPADTKDTKS